MEAVYRGCGGVAGLIQKIYAIYIPVYIYVILSYP